MLSANRGQPHLFTTCTDKAIILFGCHEPKLDKLSNHDLHNHKMPSYLFDFQRFQSMTLILKSDEYIG